MFTVALFTIGKTGKQPNCSSKDEWVKKMWYIYTEEYYLAIKKERQNAIRSKWRDPEIIIQSKPEKDKNHMILLTYGI